MQNVVIVESPAKAKTINKYLGKDFQVLASFGHVRDLPSKDGSVLPDKDFEMIYEVDDDAKRHVSEIAKAVKKATHLYLATDPDREGEAISWHVLEALNENKALKKDVTVHRVVFHEITKKAVLDAVAHPREIDMNLVNAQQARRALDYLVGFTLSPVLWRKLPGSKSAGRVQSVALRLICERDEEIEKFVAQEYWDVRILFHTDQQQAVPARLTHWQGEKLEKFSIPNGEKAETIRAALESKRYNVLSVEPRQAQRHPAAPFTTSTLQQEAARKLGFSAKRTMQVAQKLYEGVTVGGETVGLITYMRTDGVTVSEEALKDTRELIGKKYGANYLPAEAKRYKVKTSNAQEAHEAIRPTDVSRLPEDVESALGEDERRLYELIWKRMVASQMQSAMFDQVTVDIAATDNAAQLRATGSVMKFDGFLKLYREDRDDTPEDEEDENDRSLPPLQASQPLTAKEINPQQHFTEPPPRYSEASLVKKLEELGIGRPSTYASIISVLQERGYVRLDKKRFHAEMRGRVVSAFLVSFFTRYVEYDFTAQLEERLDEISAGEYDWKLLLRDFWEHFHSKVEESSKLKMSEVLEKLEQILAPVIFPRSENVEDPQSCPACKEGRLGLRLGKFGPFVGCANYPECNYTRELVPADKGEGDAGAVVEDLPKELGKDPATGMGVWLKRGPYGLYVQLGEDKKPRRSSIPKHMSAADVSLEHALGLLSLPREVGMHPESGKPITAGLGRFGPYLHHDGRFISLKGDDDPVTVGINRAVSLFAEAPAPRGRRGAIAPLRVLGKHPDDKKDVAVYEGRYGPYVKHGSTNATLPKEKEPDQVTLEEALELIAARKDKPSKKKRAPAKKATAKKKKKDA